MINFNKANEFIESEKVSSLNTNSYEVHDVLWDSVFKVLIMSERRNIIVSEWKYKNAFNYALNDEENRSGNLLEDKNLQLKFGFNFMMYIHH